MDGPKWKSTWKDRASGTACARSLTLPRTGWNPIAVMPGEPHGSLALPPTLTAAHRQMVRAGRSHRHPASTAHTVKHREDKKHRLEPLCFWQWEREEICLNTGRLPSMGHHGGFQHLQLTTGAISSALSYHGLCIWLWNLNLLMRWFPVPLGMLQNVC